MEIQHQELSPFSKAAVLMGCSRQYIYKLVALGKPESLTLSATAWALSARQTSSGCWRANPYHRVSCTGSTSTRESPLHLPACQKRKKGKRKTYEVLDFYFGEEVMYALSRSGSRGSIPQPSATAFPSAASQGKNYYSKKHVDEFFGYGYRYKQYHRLALD